MMRARRQLPAARLVWFTAVALAVTLAAASPCAAQKTTLTLAEARQFALTHQPLIRSANLNAQAASTVTAEVRSALLPFLSGNLTSVVAQDGTAVASGALTTSSLATRTAGGIVASQLVTDFGRTASLVGSVQLRAAARARQADDVRARVMLDVANAYYEALASDAVARVAQADLETRRLVLRQITALSQSDLRSTLDVSFAEVAVSEAELALDRARSREDGARERLGAAIGNEAAATVDLVDEALPTSLDGDPAPLVAAALRARSDLLALQLDRDAAARFTDAERRLRMPSVLAQGVAGIIPAHDEHLRDSYSAAGVNVSVPLFNGGLFGARRTEAALRAEAAASDVEALTLAISRDVRVSWLDSVNAFRRLDLTAKLVAQSATALRLAQSRYDLGLSGIVELTQAQLAQTSAQVAAATAKYEYLARRALLTYTTGGLP